MIDDVLDDPLHVPVWILRQVLDRCAASDDDAVTSELQAMGYAVPDAPRTRDTDRTVAFADDDPLGWIAGLTPPAEPPGS